MANSPKSTEEVNDAGHAPFIYFDGITNCGSNAGIVNVTICATRFLPDGKGGVGADVVVVGHLRCSADAAMALKDALDKALLIGAAVGGVAN